MKPSERLYQKAETIWHASFEHPFVQEIGQGTLDERKFRYFMVQDYLYLLDYAKLFAFGVTKADDEATMRQFANLLDGTMNTEMDLHRQYAAKFGITTDELAEAEQAPTTTAYTRYMLHASHNGGLGELMASLVPCAWGYHEIGKRLVEKYPDAVNHPLYGEWVKMYAGEEFAELADWAVNLMDRVMTGKPEADMKRYEEIFLTTSQYELMFWEAAYHQEDWPRFS
ncbi:thiaminase /4-amino-5-aminomethyl-2-methylpyrimidine deaminase [Salsuginibacillus halophilus]|uniref:Aminopyrimidine aminohydrolase n=1 Tax=Salsuginibacillus halophilus TaxID=517424 RepID=A0A2P8HWZ6_9BACI|nr:thiaminase II [Salsuginibacillus halophilus]PSL50737.1 thiaminase /4-amino-5-aminomethyl-2-methylpyrimidine deaminase [Salsuginibacillus halophilus]